MDKNYGGAFNLKTAAMWAGVSIPTMAGWVQLPGFPAFKVGRRWIIPRNAFAAWLAEQAEARAQL